MTDRESLYKSFKRPFQYLVLFLWLSFTVHLYALWMLNYIHDLRMSKLSETLSQRRPATLRNIILETRTESERIADDAAISDKNNIDSAPVHNPNMPEEYNVANPYLAESQGTGGRDSYVPQEASESALNDMIKSLVSQNPAPKEMQNEVQKSSEGGGETAPTYIDPHKKQIINLYNNGTPSLATHSKEYAEYLLQMQKKIEKYHREFFPIYQYYQGLLKNGQVIVEYTLDKSGEIQEAAIISSYGSETVDQSSLNSIVYSKNFGELPEALGDEVTIRFHFVYIAR